VDMRVIGRMCQEKTKGKKRQLQLTAYYHDKFRRSTRGEMGEWLGMMCVLRGKGAEKQKKVVSHGKGEEERPVGTEREEKKRCIVMAVGGNDKCRSRELKKKLISNSGLPGRVVGLGTCIGIGKKRRVRGTRGRLGRRDRKSQLQGDEH